jgi:predicted flap endonuclease-1-like 5' DNA nuclease
MEIDALDREIPEAPESASAKPAPAGHPEKDDLTLIKGVGPKLAERLNRLGITRYRQIAILRDQDLDKVNDAIGMVKGRMNGVSRQRNWPRSVNLIR